MKTSPLRTTKRIALTLGVLGLVRCSSSTTNASTAPESVGHAHSAQHASNADPSTQLITINGGDVTFPALITNSTGYRLACDSSPSGLSYLIQAAGFDPHPAVPYPVYLLNDPVVQTALHTSNVTLQNFVTLSCTPPPPDLGGLVSIEFPIEGGLDRKYFLNLPNDTDGAHPILRNVGCGELLRAMGFALSDATDLPLVLAKRGYQMGDAYDISCLGGTNPNDFVPHLWASPAYQEAERGKALPLGVTFSLQNVPPGAAMTLTKKAGADDCGFLVENGLTATGRVPAFFPKARCSTTYVATDGAGIETTPATVTFGFGCNIGTLSDCASCGDTCASPPNMAPTCASKPDSQGASTFACQPPVCKLGFGDCNQSAADGCETLLDTVANCGSCGTACSTPANGLAACKDGACQTTCNPGFADCNAVSADGCESQPASDLNNCGSCGHACPSPPNTIPSCAGGVCQTTCKDGFGDCNGSSADGCETELNSTEHCGSCANTCPGVANGSVACTNHACATTCDKLYSLTGVVCSPIDECTPTTCAHGATCTPEGTSWSCSCPPGHVGNANDPSDTCRCQTCADVGATCGSFTNACGQTLHCGGCFGEGAYCAGKTCATQCFTCSHYGVECGPVRNNCGQMLQCGSCGSNHECTANQCVYVPPPTCGCRKIGNRTVCTQC